MTRPTAAELSKTPNRVCTRCAVHKPANEFGVMANAAFRSGFRINPWCRECHNAHARAYNRARRAGLRVVAEAC